MITKREFHCKDCNKTFIIKGHWFNQMYIDWWGGRGVDSTQNMETPRKT